ncbi:MAG: diguanylate cyclase [Myxococcales bacterium]|nr:diguanylate cyclase [Myxococcales bacterium]
MDKKKTLFVDDEPKIRKAFSRTMRRSDYDAVFAEGGERALEILAEQEIPVVVTDLRMPGIDGLTLMVRVRALRPETVFVVVTGAPDLDLKADDRIDDAIASVIAKPWEDSELFDSLKLAHELHEKRRGEAQQQSNKLSVLLIDDKKSSHRLGEALSSIANVQLCNRLEIALIHLRETSFDVVLTKLSLPDARGLDAVTRAQRARPETAIVVASDIEDDDMAVQALRFGAQDYLHSRTLTPEVLLRAVLFAKERKKVECRLTELAHYDGLTGLANRMTLRDRLGVCLAKSRRYNEGCALLYIDLDFFKPINDTHGHEVGDVVLQQVAMRMRVTVREYDTVARLGGDEFAVLIEDLQKDRPEEVAERVLRRLRLPMMIGDLELRVGASGGLAVFPHAAETIDALVRCADKAMYSAKAKGRNCLHVFRPGLDQA